MFKKTKALCDSFLELGIPGFDLMVCHNGQCVLRYMSGYSDRENKIPMQGNELYDIFSCSKPITVTAAMQLWEKGLFQLDDRLCDYMPEFTHMTVREGDTVRPAVNPIRIRDLFQMTAGFSYDLNSPALEQLRVDTNGRCPTREFCTALAKEPLRFEPGDQYLYSLCHDVLAALVEVLSGQSFAAYVKEHIFDPLGMTHSNFLLPMEEYKNVAPLYRGNQQTGQIELHPNGNVPAYRLGTEHASGGAGCVSTVEDYMKFLEALRVGNILLKQETMDVIHSNRLTDHQGRTFPLGLYTYGLGMRVPIPGYPYTDFGWGGAAGAHLSVDVPHGLSIYYAQHVTLSPVQTLRSKVYNTVLEDMFGIVLPTTPPPKPSDPPLTY